MIPPWWAASSFCSKTKGKVTGLLWLKTKYVLHAFKCKHTTMRRFCYLFWLFVKEFFCVVRLLIRFDIQDLITVHVCCGCVHMKYSCSWNNQTSITYLHFRLKVAVFIQSNHIEMKHRFPFALTFHFLIHSTSRTIHNSRRVVISRHSKFYHRYI